MGHLATRLSPAVTNSETLRTPFSLKAETVLGPVILSTVPLKASWSFWDRTISSSQRDSWQNLKRKKGRELVCYVVFYSYLFLRQYTRRIKRAREEEITRVLLSIYGHTMIISQFTTTSPCQKILIHNWSYRNIVKIGGLYWIGILRESFDSDSVSRGKD